MTDPAAWSDGQRLALEQLQALAAGHGGPEVLRVTYGRASRQLEILLSIPLDGREPGPGIHLRQRETFLLIVRDDFPFAPPIVQVRHRRWAGTPHVQWGYQLCLYAAPSTEWAPSDGMRGLVDRLLLWLERAAAATLDADGVPLHPPVAYTSGASGSLVVRADLGDRVPWRCPSTDGPALLVALCTQDSRNGERLDVINWMDASEYRKRVSAGGPPKGPNGRHLVAAAAVVLTGDIGFEYPHHGGDLLSGLEQQGLPREELLALMAGVAYGNVLVAKQRGVPTPPEGEEWPYGPGAVPQMVIVGTPSREVVPGERVAHLVAWRIDSLTGKLTGRLGKLMTTSRKRHDNRDRLNQLGLDWLDTDPVRWARVFEDRRETTRRRDAESSATWLGGQRVLVLGCGALGAPVAEAVVRAGGSDVTVIDNGVITPGILVRQPYMDRDIGRPKALVLAERLRLIYPGCYPGYRVTGGSQNAVGYVSRLPAEGDDRFDLIIDATADAAVRSALERRRATTSGTWPALLTVLVGHRARRGVIAVSRAGASGGGDDVLRRLGIAARSTHATQLADVATDLYPSSPRTDVFLPEPGCSAPTFTGSHVESTALAAALLSAGLDALAGRLPGAPCLPMAAAAIRLEPTDDDAHGATGTTWVGWPEDCVQSTVDGAFQVRVSQTALGTIRAEVRRGARLRGPDIETGGMLLGQIDEAAGVVYIDDATPPTPDSLCSAVHFRHGIEGSQDLVEHYARTTGTITSFVGMWHTHPDGPAVPSRTDETGMANLVTSALGGPPRCLMLIVGGYDPAWTGWRDGADRTPPPQLYLRVVHRADSSGPPPQQPALPPGKYFRVRESIEPHEVPWWRRWLGGSR
ncbi:integrative and conjugative element protein (TIGR02256 family) [Blastococcus colisei]|uniref:Integrative and conjugative element protein (TIGR02256 family) n=1 Tax=Blastococcus colisei TaxID=1564162 RepID=A0A543PJ15_9ACTN|nr:ThiF family adenylyltransferase [Blastococcus colisei]TQN44072.1 integrative and conjugative element protein (TIGR02256 family) [Blastococcus colisei]